MEGFIHATAGLGGATALVCYSPLDNTVTTIAAALALYVGSTALDRIECGIIPHRTLTHWVPGWLALAVITGWITESRLVVCLVVSFALGATIHVIGDALTPMGVPVVSPFARISFVSHRPRWGAPAYLALFWAPVALFVLLGGIG